MTPTTELILESISAIGTETDTVGRRVVTPSTMLCTCEGWVDKVGRKVVTLEDRGSVKASVFVAKLPTCVPPPLTVDKHAERPRAFSRQDTTSTPDVSAFKHWLASFTRNGPSARAH
ncbi:hypothetical protein E4U37_007737 [Claviceps purpurea]|nr:hypothetical protein E4U37_007737 [Claviceps purpurea]